MHRTVFAIALGALLVGCAADDPAMRDRTLALLAQIPSHERTLPAAATFAARPWAVGQWAVYRMISKGEPSVQRLGIVARGADGFWVESDTQTYRHRTIWKMRYRQQPHTPEEALEAVQEILIKRDGAPVRVQKFDDPRNPMGSFHKGDRRELIASAVLGIDSDRSNRQTVRVGAGIFEGCFAFGAHLVAGPYSKDYSGWAHPAVPILGTVKGASLDWELTTELMEFGDTGAQSALP